MKTALAALAVLALLAVVACGGESGPELASTPTPTAARDAAPAWEPTAEATAPAVAKNNLEQDALEWVSSGPTVVAHLIGSRLLVSPEGEALPERVRAQLKPTLYVAIENGLGEELAVTVEEVELETDDPSVTLLVEGTVKFHGDPITGVYLWVQLVMTIEDGRLRGTTADEFYVKFHGYVPNDEQALERFAMGWLTLNPQKAAPRIAEVAINTPEGQAIMSGMSDVHDAFVAAIEAELGKGLGLTFDGVTEADGDRSVVRLIVEGIITVNAGPLETVEIYMPVGLYLDHSSEAVRVLGFDGDREKTQLGFR